MKLLIFSDLHAHNFKQFATQTETGLNSRLAEILSILSQLSEIAYENEVRAVLFAGDMFHAHTNVEHDVYNLVKEKFRSLIEYNRPVIAIAGQHDLQYKKGYRQEHVSFGGFDLPGVNFIHNEYFVINPSGRGESITIYGHSWVHPKEFKNIPFKKADIGLFHEPVINADLGGYTLEDGVDFKDVFNYYDLVVVGDIHKPFYNGKLLIPGAPLQHNFNDEGQDRGCWIYDTKTKKAEFIKLEYTPFVTAEVRPDYPCYFRKKSYVEKKKTKKKAEAVTNDLSSFKLESYLKKAKVDTSYAEVGYKLLEEAKAMSYGYLPLAIKEIEIENFMTFYGKHSFRFQDGISVIYGQTDTFDSNGAGKTNLFDAIMWAQFGKPSKKVNAPELVNWDAKRNCNVKVTYEDGTYIKRYQKDSKLNNAVEYNGMVFASLKDAKKQLAGVVGSLSLFQNMNYFSQENQALFTHMTDAERKNFFSDLLGFEKYLNAGKEARKQANKLGTKETEIESRLSVYISEKDKHKDKVEELKTLSENFDREQANELRKLQKQLDELSNNSNAFEISKLEAKKTKLEKLIADLDSDYNPKAFDTIKEKLVAHKLHADHLRSNIRALKDKQNDIDSLSGVCPVCYTKLTEKHRKAAKDYIQNEIDKTELELQNYVDEIKKLQVEYELEENRYNDYLAQEKEKKEFTEKLHKLYLQIDQLKKEQDRISSSKQEIEVKLKTLKQNSNPWKQQLQAEQNYLEEAEKKVEELQIKLDTVQQQKAIYDFWTTAFSTKTGSIVSYILDECVALFNKEMTRISDKIFNSVMRVELSTAMRLKSSDDVVDKLVFNVYKGNNAPISYDALSGGEKRRVDLAVFLVFGKIIQNMFGLPGYPFNLIILDEAVSALDEMGKDAVIDLFMTEGADKLYLISHDSYSVSSADHEVFIQKTGGKSEIVSM